MDINTNEATYEIQYGNVKRPTHFNTSWDFAKFEVCAHKWLDVSEDEYGVSILNDCKFGYSVHDGIVGLTMLKSAVYPNPEADKEYHEFTYSIIPHSGGWRQADIVQKAYVLNNPPISVRKENQGGNLPSAYSFVKVDAPNIILESIKKSEDEKSIILRMYECYNRRTSFTLTFHAGVMEAKETDMLENDESEVRVREGHKLSLEMKPYEIKTIKVKLED